MQNYLSDHGERNKRYKSQVNRLNVLMKPVSNYLSGVKGRIGAFMDNPLNALYNAYSNQIGVNLDLPISEYAKMAQNPQPGKIDPNSPAMREVMGWLPGPADNVVGLIGTVANGKKANLGIDDILSKLKAKYGDFSYTPKQNSAGGQMVHLLAPDGKFTGANVASHNDLLKHAGIGENLENIMDETGIIRMHGPDNFEIHGKPTKAQIESIANVAGPNYGAQLDIIDPNTGEFLYSDFAEFENKRELSALINELF